MHYKNHCVKSTCIRNYSGPSFPHLDWKRRDIPYSSYSVWMRENVDQNNSEYQHFLRSELFTEKLCNICLIWSHKNMSFLLSMHHQVSRSTEKSLSLIFIQVRIITPSCLPYLSWYGKWFRICHLRIYLLGFSWKQTSFSINTESKQTSLNVAYSKKSSNFSFKPYTGNLNCAKFTF